MHRKKLRYGRRLAQAVDEIVFETSVLALNVALKAACDQGQVGTQITANTLPLIESPVLASQLGEDGVEGSTDELSHVTNGLPRMRNAIPAEVRRASDGPNEPNYHPSPDPR